ncbi:hypothetical protein [Rhodospirillaceae bacterium SYSU D60014]|uniref:hypothetical protein n=1 Tax=Virgifigura deserti TaxID=2268457 RepID=UPI000E66AD22
MRRFGHTTCGLATIVALVAPLGLAACATQTGATYSATEVGAVMATTPAVVLTSREVHIEGGDTGVYGPALGAALGGTGGFYGAGAGGTDSAIFAGLGALIGGGLGYAAEEFADARRGIEYVLRDSTTGQTITVVQTATRSEALLPPETPVLLQEGDGYTRVVAAPGAQ